MMIVTKINYLYKVFGLRMHTCCGTNVSRILGIDENKTENTN